ncbi:MAG: hypothetical protein COY81_04770 [Candidatus Pacebacteria bacterium CG_4_10_14_0_8_um_filter_43_12]|nr:MAG: hypothetical protein COY81_04770 [Candidatus Pacebacteria bacterium CG_4_10_14_0_8_um_filter_43_12]
MFKENSAWWVYIVECADGSFYTGSTPDITSRVKKHNDGMGAKYTRNHLPVKLVYFEPYPDRSAAAKREIELKKLKHRQKKELAVGFEQ